MNYKILDDSLKFSKWNFFFSCHITFSAASMSLVQSHIYHSWRWILGCWCCIMAVWCEQQV